MLGSIALQTAILRGKSQAVICLEGLLDVLRAVLKKTLCHRVC